MSLHWIYLFLIKIRFSSNFSMLHLINNFSPTQGMPLWSHDYVFWCGDFNYRINLPRDEVLDLVQRKEWGQLLDSDQLLVAM